MYKIFSFIDWKIEQDPARAAQLYRAKILDIHAGKPLHLHVDLRGSKLDQEMALIAFYKARSMEWANPLQCILEGSSFSLFVIQFMCSIFICCFCFYSTINLESVYIL